MGCGQCSNLSLQESTAHVYDVQSAYADTLLALYKFAYKTRQVYVVLYFFQIETRPVYYDSNNIYFEQKVISIRDEIVRCLAHVKLAVNLDLDKVIAKHFPDTVKVPAPKDLELYIDYNRVNSERLRVTKKRSKSLTLQEIENDDVNKQGEQLLDT